MSYTPYTGPTDEDDLRGDNEIQHVPVSARKSSRLVRLFVLGSFLVILATLMSVLALSLAARSSNPEKGLAEAPNVGSLAPDFELLDVKTGKPVKLSSFKGKPVWINFWASWCPPCREEMPDMEKLYARYKDKGLVILGVDVQEKSGDVMNYINQGNFSWTFVLDTAGKTTDRYQVTGLPSHIFVDRNRVIQAIHIGGLTNMTGLKAPIEGYLGKIIGP